MELTEHSSRRRTLAAALAFIVAVSLWAGLPGLPGPAALPAHAAAADAPVAAVSDTPHATAGDQPGGRPTIALALGGGSARGLTHIGLLKALEEAGIPIDFLVGTSMGSLVAGLYASGMSVDNLIYLVTTVEFGHLFEPLAPTRGGLVGPQRLEHFIDLLTDNATFDRLAIPFYAVLTHLETGQEVVWNTGRISRGILGSTAIPGTFPPVELDGEYYVDGGVASLVPVEAARRLGADVVIAADVRGYRRGPVNPHNPLEVLNTVLTHLLTANADAQLGLADVVVFPDISHNAHMAYDRAADLIQAGYEAAQQVLPQIRAVLLERDPAFPFGQEPPNAGWPEDVFAERVTEAMSLATADVHVLQLAALPSYEISGGSQARLQAGFEFSVGNVGPQPLYGMYSLMGAEGTWVHTLGLGVGTCRGICGAVFMRHGMNSQRWSPGLLIEGLADDLHYVLEWESRATETEPGWAAGLMFPVTSEALLRRRQVQLTILQDPRGLYGPAGEAVRGEAIYRWYLPAETRDVLGFLRGATHWYFGAGIGTKWDGTTALTPVLEAGVLLNEYVFGLHPVRLRAALTYRGGDSWALRLSLGE